MVFLQSAKEDVWQQLAHEIRREARAIRSSLKNFRETVIAEGLSALLSDDNIDEDGKRTLIFRALERQDTPPGQFLRRALETFSSLHPASASGGIEEQKTCGSSVAQTRESEDGGAKEVEVKDGEGCEPAPIQAEGMSAAADGEQMTSCVEDVKSIIHHLIVAVLEFYPELKSSEGVSLTIAAVERVVFQHIYATVFAEVEVSVAQDIQRLEDRYQEEAEKVVMDHSLRCASPNAQHVIEAVESLALLSKSRTGYDKLRCLVTTCERLTANKHVTADELLPRFAQALVQARTPKLPAELVFIEHFCDRQMLLGAEGYALTTIQAALTMVLLGHHGVSP